MVVLGGLKPLRLSSSGSGEAGAPEEGRAVTHAKGIHWPLVSWCLLMSLDPTASLPC